jgi:hypothetical protein
MRAIRFRFDNYPQRKFISLVDFIYFDEQHLKIRMTFVVVHSGVSNTCSRLMRKQSAEFDVLLRTVIRNFYLSLCRCKQYIVNDYHLFTNLTQDNV